MTEKDKLQTLDFLLDKIVFTQEKDRFLRAHGARMIDIMANNAEMTHWQNDFSTNRTPEERQTLLKRYMLQFMKHPYPNGIAAQKMQTLNLNTANTLEVLHQLSADQPINQMLLKMCAYGQMGSFLFPGQENERFFNQSSTQDLLQDLPNILTEFENKRPSSTLRYRAGCDLYHRCIPFLWENVSSLACAQSADTIKQFLAFKGSMRAPLSSLLNRSEILSLLKGRSLAEKKEILSSRHIPNESVTLGNMLTNLLNQPLQTLIGSEGIALAKDCLSQREKVQTHLKSFVQNPIQTATQAHQFLKQIWQRSQKQ